MAVAYSPAVADDAKPKAHRAGRATPKGGGPKPTGRYTPPTPDSYRSSPIWVPILMFSLLGIGVLVIITNYVDLLPGNGPSNTYLLVGLGCITAGFITATRYR